MNVINTILFLETSKNEMVNSAETGNPIKIALAMVRILKDFTRRLISSLPTL